MERDGDDSMKVTGQNLLNPKEIASGNSREADQGARKSKATGAESTPTQGSRTSLIFNRLKEAIRGTPDVRSDRVESIKQQIENGTYKVDSEKLAAKMLTESLQEDIER